MPAELPPLPSLALIAERLSIVFPEGVEHRNYVVREMAARTVFVMFYAGAVEGGDRWIRPSMVTDMTDAQAAAVTDEARLGWHRSMSSSKKVRAAGTWYAVNSREPIRDETLRLDRRRARCCRCSVAGRPPCIFQTLFSDRLTQPDPPQGIEARG